MKLRIEYDDSLEIAGRLEFDGSCQDAGGYVQAMCDALGLQLPREQASRNTIAEALADVNATAGQNELLQKLQVAQTAELQRLRKLVGEWQSYAAIVYDAGTKAAGRNFPHPDGRPERYVAPDQNEETQVGRLHAQARRTGTH